MGVFQPHWGIIYSWRKVNRDRGRIDLKKENLINKLLRLFRGDISFLTLHLLSFLCMLAVAIGTEQAISRDVSEKVLVLTGRGGCDTRFTFGIFKIIFFS